MPIKPLEKLYLILLIILFPQLVVPMLFPLLNSYLAIPSAASSRLRRISPLFLLFMVFVFSTLFSVGICAERSKKTSKSPAKKSSASVSAKSSPKSKSTANRSKSKMVATASKPKSPAAKQITSSSAKPSPAYVPGSLSPIANNFKPLSALDKEAPFRRFLWITRWDYRTAQDIERICYNAAAARFTDILFQVRGAGTVYYPSAIEPWAGELSQQGVTGWDPGWDPLATAVKQGHRWGLRVHAYMNTMPGYNDKEVSSGSAKQLYSAHRDWFMVGRNGQPMQANGWYAFVDPGLPEVREYLASLYAEVAKNYAVDGIHLDYVRYPHEAGDFSYHPRVLKSFKETCGGTPDSNPELWRQFRRDQITATVKAIHDAAKKARPSIELSAAVLADPEGQRNDACQSPAEWIKMGIVDAVAPMAYTGDLNRFDFFCQHYMQPEFRDHLWLGIWADPGRNAYLATQIKRAANLGFGAIAVFSYTELFPDHKTSTRATGVYQAFVAKSKK